MPTFDFLSGMSGPNANAQAYAPMQQYQQFANTGAPAGMDYSQILGGGQASPATQGLDFGKIGEWALQRSQYAGQKPDGMDWTKMAGMMGPTQPTQGSTPTQSPLQARQHAVQLGQIQQGQSGYIGNGTRSGLLGMMR